MIPVPELPVSPVSPTKQNLSFSTCTLVHITEHMHDCMFVYITGFLTLSNNLYTVTQSNYPYTQLHTVKLFIRTKFTQLILLLCQEKMATLSHLC